MGVTEPEATFSACFGGKGFSFFLEIFLFLREKKSGGAREQES